MYQIISFPTSYGKLINVHKHTDLFPKWAQYGELVVTTNVANKKLEIMLWTSWDSNNLNL